MTDIASVLFKISHKKKNLMTFSQKIPKPPQISIAILLKIPRSEILMNQHSWDNFKCPPNGIFVSFVIHKYYLRACTQIGSEGIFKLPFWPMKRWKFFSFYDFQVFERTENGIESFNCFLGVLLSSSLLFNIKFP